MGRSVYLPCLFANLAVRSNVIGAVEVEFIDLGLWHELINFEGTGAFKRNGLKFFRLNFEVLTLADFVAIDDVGGLDLFAQFYLISIRDKGRRRPMAVREEGREAGVIRASFVPRTWLGKAILWRSIAKSTAASSAATRISANERDAESPVGA